MSPNEKIKYAQSLYERALVLFNDIDSLEKTKKCFFVAKTASDLIKNNKDVIELYLNVSIMACKLGYDANLYDMAYEIGKNAILRAKEHPELKEKLEVVYTPLLKDRNKIRRTHKYKIVKEYSIDKIFSIIGSDKTFEFKGHKYFQDNEHKVKLRRACIYKKIGVDCVSCDTKATHFALGLDKGNNYHLDLYGYDKEGNLVMITIDHIHPRCKGGEDKVENYQPMCKICNENKGGDI